MILRCQPSPARWRGVEAPTSRFDSQGCPVHRRLRPRAEEAGRILSTRLLQLAEVDVLHSAKNGIWYQVSETPIGGRRVTRVVSQAARGALEHASAAPLSSTLCALPVQAIDDAQGQVRSRRTQVRRTFAYQCVQVRLSWVVTWAPPDAVCFARSTRAGPRVRTGGRARTKPSCHFCTAHTVQQRRMRRRSSIAASLTRQNGHFRIAVAILRLRGQ